MGALRRPYSLPAANAAGPLDEAISPAPSFHQREALVRRQQSRAGRRVRYAARTRRRRKKSHDPQSLFLRKAARAGPAHQAVFATGDGAACKSNLARRQKMTELVLAISGSLPNAHN